MHAEPFRSRFKPQHSRNRRFGVGWSGALQVKQAVTELCHHCRVGEMPQKVHRLVKFNVPPSGIKILEYLLIQEDAVMTGVATRTSSPVRMTRGDVLQSLNVRGLFPAGEGAGYAGGILSAAVDGIKVAEAVALSATARIAA